MTTVAAVLLDVIGVLLFAAVGRRSHAETGGLPGVLATAWPFLVGAGLGWITARAWHRPLAVVRTGVPVWLGTVVVGMALRQLSGLGTAPAFVAVAAVVLGTLILGWRAATRLRRSAAGDSA